MSYINLIESINIKERIEGVDINSKIENGIKYVKELNKSMVKISDQLAGI